MTHTQNRSTTPAFATLQDFVSGFVVHAYARQVVDTNHIVWCPQWWQHPEAVLRLHAMHRAYEALRTQGGPLGASLWWLEHADPHMRHLLAVDGPFKYCSVRGHNDRIGPLPTDPPPTDLWLLGPDQDTL